MYQPDDIVDLKSRFQNLVDEQIRDNSYVQTQPEDFRFLIFSGTASSLAFQDIRNTIIELFPKFESRIREDIDPFWVATIGAARLAKKYAIEQPVTVVNSQWLDYSHENTGEPDSVQGRSEL